MGDWGTADGQESGSPSSAWLSRLPDSEAKRKFILDCTGYHQFDEKIARIGGRPRTEAEWAEAVTRMLGYAGARTGFPIIAADRDPASTAAWLTKHLGPGRVQEPILRSRARARITEFFMPEPGDLHREVRDLSASSAAQRTPGALTSTPGESCGFQPIPRIACSASTPPPANSVRFRCRLPTPLRISFGRTGGAEHSGSERLPPTCCCATILRRASSSPTRYRPEAP